MLLCWRIQQCAIISTDAPVNSLPRRNSGDADQLLTTSDLAELLGVSCQWVEIGRHRGYGPPFVRLAPRVVRYRRGDLRVWFEQRQHQHTAEYA